MHQHKNPCSEERVAERCTNCSQARERRGQGSMVGSFFCFWTPPLPPTMSLDWVLPQVLQGGGGMNFPTAAWPLSSSPLWPAPPYWVWAFLPIAHWPLPCVQPQKGAMSELPPTYYGIDTNFKNSESEASIVSGHCVLHRQYHLLTCIVVTVQ